MKSCSTCAHISRQWPEQPCVSCQQGEERGNWEPRIIAFDERPNPIHLAWAIERANRAHAERLMRGAITGPSTAPPTFAPAPEAVALGHTPAQSQKARRRAIAREWSTYLGVKIRARHVKAMLRLADDVEGRE